MFAAACLRNISFCLLCCCRYECYSIMESSVWWELNSVMKVGFIANIEHKLQLFVPSAHVTDSFYNWISMWEFVVLVMCGRSALTIRGLWFMWGKWRLTDYDGLLWSFIFLYCYAKSMVIYTFQLNQSCLALDGLSFVPISIVYQHFLLKSQFTLKARLVLTCFFRISQFSDVLPLSFRTLCC